MRILNLFYYINLPMHNTIISQLEGLKILGMKIKNPLDNYAIRNNAI